MENGNVDGKTTTGCWENECVRCEQEICEAGVQVRPQVVFQYIQ